jgi:protein involved in polysaccharide export with SLBB domain
MKSKMLARFLMIICGVLATGMSGAFAQEAALRVGQSFIIRVTGVPQEDQLALTQEYTIGDNGLIRLQYIEPIQASGLKPSALASVIEQKFKAAEIYTKPTVNVVASGAGNDPTSYVTVLGEVKLPQNVPFRPGMTILDAIAGCNGFTDFAKPQKTKYISGGKERIIDLGKGGGADAGIKLKVGDKVIVPD